MKALILLALIAAAVADDFYYTTGNDYLDVAAFFADENLAVEYFDCYMDRGPCSDLAMSYKVIIPEAVEQACRRCNSPQKHIFWEYLEGLKALYPESYEEFKQKYDPENKYFEALIEEISKYSFYNHEKKRLASIRRNIDLFT